MPQPVNPNAIEPPLIWDVYALLTLFDEVNKVGLVDGNLKVQKLAFLIELEGADAKVKAAHFKFVRQTLGPYSRFLAGVTRRLKQLGFVDNRRRLTARGRFFMEYAGDAVMASQTAVRAVDVIKKVSHKHGATIGPYLTNYVYDLSLPVRQMGGRVQQVRSIPMGIEILDPSIEPNLQEVAPFDSQMLADLREELTIPPENLRPGSAAVRRAAREALAGLN